MRGIAGMAVIGGGIPDAGRLEVGGGGIPFGPGVGVIASLVGVVFELLLGILFIGIIAEATGVGCGEENIVFVFGL